MICPSVSLFFSLVISAGKKRCRTANLQKIRRHYEQDTLREQIIPHDESHRFRYFYQIRRAHGDALSTVSRSILDPKVSTAAQDGTGVRTIYPGTARQSDTVSVNKS